MRFTETEYHYFEDWFENTLKDGLYPFYFSQVDRSGNTVTKTYQFTKDGSPQISNVSGNIIDCTMKWEELS